MKIREIEGFDAQKVAVDSLAKNAKQVTQNANVAKAKLKVKQGQQQLAKAVIQGNK